jgi:hypothetical protein
MRLKEKVKRTLSNLVMVFGLLAFFVSSAACFGMPLPEVNSSAHMHAMNGSSHACCPKQSSGSQMSNACCTIHHQPASPSSTLETQQSVNFQLPVASSIPLPEKATVQLIANDSILSSQPPPLLIALRI